MVPTNSLYCHQLHFTSPHPSFSRSKCNSYRIGGFAPLPNHSAFTSRRGEYWHFQSGSTFQTKVVQRSFISKSLCFPYLKQTMCIRYPFNPILWWQSSCSASVALEMNPMLTLTLVVNFRIKTNVFLPSINANINSRVNADVRCEYTLRIA